MAVGDVVVEHAEHVVLARLERERAQDLVGADGVLDQQDRSSRPPTMRALGASERGARARQRRCDRSQRHAERTVRGGGRGERVVDVVEARQRQLDRAPRPSASCSVKRAARSALERDIASRTPRGCGRAHRRRGSGSGRGGRGRRRRRRRGLRSCGSAWRRRHARCAAVRASRPRRRSRAGARVRGRGRRRVGRRRSARARAGARLRRERLAPVVGDRLELAIAVELVAEEVAEQDDARARARRAPREATASSTSKSPSSPSIAPRGRAAASSVAAMPPAMFAPASLCTSASPCRRGSPRASSRSSSCRWWRTPARCPVTAGSRARSSPAGRVAAAPCPVRSWRRRPESRRSCPRRARPRACRAGPCHQPGVGAPAAWRMGAPGETTCGASGCARGSPLGLAAVLAAARRRAAGWCEHVDRGGQDRTRKGSSPIGSPSAYIVNGRSAETRLEVAWRGARRAGRRGCP